MNALRVTLALENKVKSYIITRLSKLSQKKPYTRLTCNALIFFYYTVKINIFKLAPNFSKKKKKSEPRRCFKTLIHNTNNNNLQNASV